MKMTKSACALFAGLFVLMQGACSVPAASGGLRFSEGVIVKDRPCSVTVRDYVSNNGDAEIIFDGNSPAALGLLPDGSKPICGAGFSYVKIAETADANTTSGELFTFTSSDFTELLKEQKAGPADDKSAYTAEEISLMVLAANARSEPAVRNFIGRTGEKMPDTDDDGETYVSGLSQGIYLFAETKSPDGVIPGSPFCVILPQTNVSEVTVDSRTYDPGEIWLYDLTVYPKSRSVSITKKILESDAASGNTGSDSTSAGQVHLVDRTSACTGDVVTFLVTSNVPRLSSDTANRLYTIEDALSDGLKFSGDLSLTLGADEETAVPLTEKSDYKWSIGAANSESPDMSAGQKLTITFTKKGLARLDRISEASRIYVKYNAVLDKNAVLEGQGNTNTAILIYGTTHSEDTCVASNPVAVYTYMLSLTKTFSPEREHFAKVKFSMTKGGEKIYFVRETDGVYHVACPDEEDDETVLISPNDTTGLLTVKGLASATYLITEEETAEDYSLLGESIELVIRNKNMVMSVENLKSIDLVHTGGMGLYLVFTVSSALLLAGVLIISYARKKS